MDTSQQEHESQSTRLTIALVTIIVITFIAFILRLYTRVCLLRSTGAEDYCIAAAMIFAIANTSISVAQAKIALGKHIWTVTPKDLMTNAKLLYAVIQVYTISIMLTKLSFVLQYSRIFRHGRIQIWWGFVGAIAVIQAILGCFATIFSCRPIEFFWDWSIPGGKCLPQKPVYFATASLNLATDLAIFASPIPLVARLHLPRRQRWSVAAIFLLGSCTCIIAVVKITTFSKSLHTKDPTWDFVNINLWSTIELDVGIICACLTSFKPLIVRYFPRALFSSISGSFIVSVVKTQHSTTTHTNKKWGKDLLHTNADSAMPVENSDEIPLANLKESWSTRGACEVVGAPVSASTSYYGERQGSSDRNYLV